MAGRGQAPSRPRNMRHTLRVLLDYMGRAQDAACRWWPSWCTVSALANLLGTYMIKPVVNAVGAGDFARSSRLVVADGVHLCRWRGECRWATRRPWCAPRRRWSIDIRRDLSRPHSRGCRCAFFDSTAPRRRHELLHQRRGHGLGGAQQQLCHARCRALIQTVGTLTLLVVLDWRLSLITLVPATWLMCLLRALLRRQEPQVLFGRSRRTLGELDGYVEEMVAGQKVVKVFNHEDASQADFDGAERGAAPERHHRAEPTPATMVPVTVAVSYMNFAVVCVVGALLALGGLRGRGKPCQLPGVCPPGLPCPSTSSRSRATSC